MFLSMTKLSSSLAIRLGIIRRGSVLVLLGISVLCMTACGPKEATVDPVVLEVGTRVVHLSDLQAQVDFWQKKQGGLPADQATFVQQYISRLVALETARELGLHEDVELQRQWENMLIGHLKQTDLASQIGSMEVSAAEIDEAYQQRIDAYTQPAQLRLALLYLSAPKHLSSEGRTALVERLQDARKLAAELPAETRGFGALAMSYSEEATSRFKGGDVGWMRAGANKYRWPNAVVEAGFDLVETGDMSPVVETEEGVYLVMRLDGRDAVVRPLDDRLRETLSAQLLREKRADLIARQEVDWAGAMTIKVHQDSLSELEFLPDFNDVGPSTELTRIP